MVVHTCFMENYGSTSISSTNVIRYYEIPYGVAHRRNDRFSLEKVRPNGMVSDVVWLKYCVGSRHLSIIVAQQSTEALPPHHGTRVATHYPLPRDQVVVETLMIPLRMIVAHILVDRIRQGAFPQHDHLREGLLLDRPYESFAMGIEIRA